MVGSVSEPRVTQTMQAKDSLVVKNEKAGVLAKLHLEKSTKPNRKVISPLTWHYITPFGTQVSPSTLAKSAKVGSGRKWSIGNSLVGIMKGARFV